jgi:CO/xanthine dehydrogenase Mo-binding subunit
VNDYKAIGKPTPLVDGRARVTGALRYAPDFSLPGMLHARLVLSPHAHARIESIDSQSALAVPGVVAVLTAADMPEITASKRALLMLARGRVIFAGQPVALVLAENEAAAEDGVEQAHVEYEPLPAAITMQEALAKDAPLVWPQGVGDSGEIKTDNIAAEDSKTRGDVKAGFAQADVIVERVFTSGVVHQSPIETQGMLIQPDLFTGGANVWVSTQGQFEVRQNVAEVLGVEETAVRVHPTPVGGGFGSKVVIYEPMIAVAARLMNRPVRLILTRMEEMAAGNPAPALHLRVKVGAKADGTLTALDTDVLLDTGCFTEDWLGAHAGFMLGYYYRFPHYRIQVAEVFTFKPSVGAYRAPCGQTTNLAMESLMDEIAQQLNIDPIDLRLHNAIQKGDLAPDGNRWPRHGMREVLETLRAHPVWQNREQARAAGRGIGIAIGGWPGGFDPAAAVCSVNREGRLMVEVGTSDISGSLTSLGLIAAEAFGVSAEGVQVVVPDTSSAPYTGVTGGSKVVFAVGPAVEMAAREARQQVLQIASDELEAALEDLEIVDGRVQVRGVPAKAITLRKIVSKTQGFNAPHPPVVAHGRFAQKLAAPVFDGQLAEIELDPETGVIRVFQLVVIQDAGRAINPLSVHGQLHGGATQGIGWALYEQMLYDQGGQLLTGTLMDYALPNSRMTAPVIETVIVEVPSENGPFGARGVGESPAVPTAAAIANALADMTHVRMTQLPMTAPRVLAALRPE